jgi:hypothetical protein
MREWVGVKNLDGQKMAEIFSTSAFDMFYLCYPSAHFTP